MFSLGSAKPIRITDYVSGRTKTGPKEEEGRSVSSLNLKNWIHLEKGFGFSGKQHITSIKRYRLEVLSIIG